MPVSVCSQPPAYVMDTVLSQVQVHTELNTITVMLGVGHLDSPLIRNLQQLLSMDITRATL